uniref:Putative secreted protein n=1 Tax=Anopheles darlingi TaxID=43151 RepID=A0A2M4DNS0_ANODA
MTSVAWAFSSFRLLISVVAWCLCLWPHSATFSALCVRASVRPPPPFSARSRILNGLPSPGPCPGLPGIGIVQIVRRIESRGRRRLLHC